MKRLLVLALLVGLLTLGGIYFATDWLAPVPDFRIYLEEEGVYRIDWEDLVDAGLPRRTISDRMTLLHRNEPVPLHVESREPGRFGPGDWLELRADRLQGRNTHLHRFSPFNVYQLQFGDTAGPAMRAHDAPGASAQEAPTPWRTRHLEQDTLMIRLAAHNLPEEQEEPEIWYWAKLSHLDPIPLSIVLPLDDLATEGPTLDDLASGTASPDALDAPTNGTIAITVQFQGMSQLPRHPSLREAKDHQVDLLLNGELIGSTTWNGKRQHRFTVDDVPMHWVRAGTNQLELHVPKRSESPGDPTVIDVVMLDWVSVRYPQRLRLDDQLRVAYEAPTPADAALEVTSETSRIVAYDDLGGRTPLGAIGPATDGGGARFALPVTASSRTVDLVAGDALHRPLLIEPDTRSSLRETTQQTDYLMITHPRLARGVDRLADFHRERGLAVKVIDVQDVYDEWNGGIAHPRAIRDFIAHAYHRWPAPRPRFVLLAGDASWDTKNRLADDANYANWASRELTEGGTRFLDHGVPRITQTALPADARNLIPTGSFASREGHSASDNYFVAVDGDDLFPDLAIGRFPVTELEEIEAIVDKTIRYAGRPSVGPWRRSVLWITNEEIGFQMRTDRTARDQQSRGFAAVKVYPDRHEADNAGRQQDLKSALDDGQLLVHFYGHGGRHIWRTGPPDLQKNHDLFTLEHIEELTPSDRLPVVLSMTCYSAPFDHPSADSIGEKFLRVPGRGAVAVFAASWRNIPTPRYSMRLLEELTTPGTPIGIAIQNAKQGLRNNNLIATYNLLGDPAIPLAVPALRVDVEPRGEAGTAEHVRVTIDTPRFTGRAMVDWIDRTGNVVHSQTLRINAPTFEASVTDEVSIPPHLLDGVQVYVWNERKGIDGIGAFDARPEDTRRPAHTGRAASP